MESVEFRGGEGCMQASRFRIAEMKFGTIVAIVFNPAGATGLAGILMINLFAGTAEIADGLFSNLNLT